MAEKTFELEVGRKHEPYFANESLQAQVAFQVKASDTIKLSSQVKQ